MLLDNFVWYQYPWAKISREFFWFEGKPGEFPGLKTSCVSTWKQAKSLKRFRFVNLGGGSKPFQFFACFHVLTHGITKQAIKTRRIPWFDSFCPLCFGPGISQLHRSDICEHFVAGIQSSKPKLNMQQAREGAA